MSITRATSEVISAPSPWLLKLLNPKRFLIIVGYSLPAVTKLPSVSVYECLQTTGFLPVNFFFGA